MPHGAAAFTPALSELADEYEILGELGRGGSAVVYRARDRVLGREVAIKVVGARLAATDDDAVTRLAREARTVAQLQHPNIVTVFAVRRIRAGGLALVMPLVPGRTLKQIVQRDGPLAPDRCERILRDVAAALSYAHARGVVHRDVKPENIFLDEDTGRALLADFGIAVSDEAESLTLTGTAIGTPFYMSPEQIDNAPLDGRSDLYSLGLVAWEMLTGQRPWDGESLYNVIAKQKEAELPPIEALRPGVPPRLQYIVERMLQKQPGARWAGADGLLAQLSHTVLPRDYPRWQIAHRRRVEQYRAAARARAAAPRQTQRDPGGLASVTMRLFRGATRRATAADAPPALADTMSVAVPPELRSAPPSDDTQTFVSPPPSDDTRTFVARPPAPGAPSAGGDDAATGPVAVPTPTVPATEPAAAQAGGRPRRITPRELEPTWAVQQPRRGRAVAIALAAATVAAAAWVGRGPLADLVPRAASGRDAPALDRDDAARRVVAGVMDAPTAERAAAPAAADGEPGAVVVPVGRTLGTIAAGGRHTCLVTTGAAVECWGANDRGQLGDGTFARRTLPRRVTGDFAFATVVAGASHSCAVTRVGEAYCWGSNTRGQLGDATTVRREAPVRVAGSAIYRAVRAGASHTCALTLDGSVQCWGANDRGQLGDGTRTTLRSRPAAVTPPGRGVFAAITLGGAHTCALAADGTAYCWGANESGQLGDGTRDDRATPTAVLGGHRFAAIAAGQSHSCAITSAGAAYCWGRNAFGQVGTGRPGPVPEPTRVRLGEPTAQLATGSVHTCALATTGDVFCWGRNGYGQVGDGTTVDRPLPVRVRPPEPVAELDATGAHTCALAASGRAYCWGYNGEGQLGDSSVVNRPVPTPVAIAPLTPAAPGVVAAQAPR